MLVNKCDLGVTFFIDSDVWMFGVVDSQSPEDIIIESSRGPQMAQPGRPLSITVETHASDSEASRLLGALDTRGRNHAPFTILFKGMECNVLYDRRDVEMSDDGDVKIVFHLRELAKTRIAVATPEGLARRAAEVIAEGAAAKLDGAKVINRVKSGFWIDYQSREWPISVDGPDVKEALALAAALSVPRTPTIADVESAAAGQVVMAARRIREAAIGRLFPKHDPDDSKPRATPPPRPGGVDVSKMAANARAMGAPARVPPRQKGAEVRRPTARISIAVDGKDAILHFGRHRGKRLSDIVQTDKDYLQWMINEPGDFPRDLIDVARWVLNNPLEAPRVAKARPHEHSWRDA